MKKTLILLAGLLTLSLVGCGGETKASADDKSNIERLTTQGMTPQSSGQAENQSGTPISGKVEDP